LASTHNLLSENLFDSFSPPPTPWQPLWDTEEEEGRGLEKKVLGSFGKLGGREEDIRS
jgi:hypothetical protein